MTPETQDVLIERYEGGMSLSRIGLMEDMPCYSTILRHIKNSADFREKIQAARMVRALHFEDQALEVAAAESGAIGKDDVPGARLAYDANVWAAGVNDPTRYGKKITHAGDASNPIAFTVVTGVPQPELVSTIELNADGTVKSMTPEETS
jgi:hypothetical protein